MGREGENPLLPSITFVRLFVVKFQNVSIMIIFFPSLFDAFVPQGRVIARSLPSPFWLHEVYRRVWGHVHPSTKNTLENLRH